MDALILALTIPIQLPPRELPVGDEAALFQHLAARREKLEAEQRRLREMRLHGDYDNALDEYFAELAWLRHELEQLPAADHPLAEQRQALDAKHIHFADDHGYSACGSGTPLHYR